MGNVQGKNNYMMLESEVHIKSISPIFAAAIANNIPSFLC